MALCRYAFVATTEQNFTLQEHALRTAGCEVSCRDGRTELARLLEGLRRGETRVVPQVDRLARHITDLQDIVYRPHTPQGGPYGRGCELQNGF